jgi:hypothetical protein
MVWHVACREQHRSEKGLDFSYVVYTRGGIQKPAPG